MSKATALYDFWAGFDIPAYDENSVPDGDDKPRFPYITFSDVKDSIGNVVATHASLWYRSTSWDEAEAKAQEISEYIGLGGRVIELERGYIWINRGTPFSQRMGDPDDDLIRRIYINVQVEYLTDR